MKALIYRVELLTPALFGRVEGDPNSSVSYPYIPGSVIRAALFTRFAQTEGVSLEHVLDHERTADVARRLFFGNVRFLNAYPAVPEVQSPERMLPTPRSWYQNKSQRVKAREDEEHKVPIFDLAVDQPEGDEPNQRVTAPFCWLGDPEEECARVRLLSPRRRVAIHTQRATANRNFGRPRKGDGAVYRYDALDAGQTFIGAILCDDADEKTLEPLLNGEFWIGKAHTAGYGRARFKYLRADSSWREVGGCLAPAQEELIATLLSPLLLRNQYGQFTVDAEHLARRLGEALGAEVTLERAFVGVEVVGGFNRKWGLPLPQAHAFAAGSVLVLKAAQVVPADKLQALEQVGLGERLNEGFGRLAFNWQQWAKLCIEAQPDPQGSRVALAEPFSRQLAERMAQRLLAQRLEQLCLSRAAQLQIHPPPSRTQLNRLRSITLNALNDPEPAARLKSFLESATKRQTVREQWERARVLEVTSSQRVQRPSAQPFNQWIEVIAKALDEQDPVAWAQTLKLARANEVVVRVQLGDVEVTPSLEQRRALTLRLLAEVLRRAVRASKSTNQAQGGEP